MTRGGCDDLVVSTYSGKVVALMHGNAEDLHDREAWPGALLGSARVFWGWPAGPARPGGDLEIKSGDPIWRSDLEI